MNSMRRLWASLLLVLVSYSLIAPALLAGAETQLPECCRRMGQHHCASTGQDVPGAHFRNAADHCPYFPAAPATPVRQYTPFLNTVETVSAGLVAHRAVEIEGEFEHDIVFCLSHPKRGPPRLAAC